MKLKIWRELDEGAVIKNCPTSFEYKTGEWKKEYPFFNSEKCTHCLLCWLYCPDFVIKVKNGKVFEFDLDYCKGCGICESVCPKEAIVMKEEKI